MQGNGNPVQPRREGNATQGRARARAREPLLPGLSLVSSPASRSLCFTEQRGELHVPQGADPLGYFQSQCAELLNENAYKFRTRLFLLICFNDRLPDNSAHTQLLLLLVQTLEHFVICFWPAAMKEST